MQICEALEKYEFYCLRHSPQTRVWYKSRLARFKKWCDAQGYTELGQITVKIIRTYLDELSEAANEHTGGRLSSYTVHGHARVVRRLWTWMSKEEDYDGLIDPRIGLRIPMPRLDKKVVEIFSKDEITRLFAAAGKNQFRDMAARNRAILSVLLDTGIRAGELCGLTIDHVYIFPNEAYIRVLGKGSKWREVGLGQKSQAALSDYIEHHRPVLNESHVFITHRGDPLVVNALEQALHKIAKRANIADAHPHKFRHTFAFLYIMQKAGDLHSLSKIMGHEDSQITTNYLKAVQAMQARTLSKSVLDFL